jgi:TonB family protein
MAPSDIKFKANPAERWLQSRAAALRGEPSRFFAFLAVGIVYAAILTLVLFEDRRETPAAPAEIVTPVEIVIEPPPPPPPPPQKPDPPQESVANPPPSQILEEPATDAPRPSKSDKPETDKTDESAKVGAAPPPPKPPEPVPNPGKAAGPTREGEMQPKDDSAERLPDNPASDTRPSAEADRPKPEQQQARAESESKIETPKAAPDFQFPSFDSVPDVDFGSAAKQTSVAGGKAKATYLTMLYGLIMPHMRSVTAALPKSGKLEGTIVFTVDGKGQVRDRRIVRQSGSHDLDAAALDAITQAAPFPTPPNNAPIGLRFNYGAQ